MFCANSEITENISYLVHSYSYTYSYAYPIYAYPHIGTYIHIRKSIRVIMPQYNCTRNLAITEYKPTAVISLGILLTSVRMHTAVPQHYLSLVCIVLIISFT